MLYAEPNYIYHASVIPNDPLFGQLYGMDKILAPSAWGVSSASPNTIVAVIDSGVEYTHSDLAGNIWTNQAEKNGSVGVDDDGNGYIDDIYGYDFFNYDGSPMDDNSHGTHVAGTIGAVGNNNTGVAGICWNVQIMAVKFLNADGAGTLADAASAINYAVQMGAKVMNNSWGGGGYSQVLRDAIVGAHNAGVIFVAAAGTQPRIMISILFTRQL